MIKGVAMSRPPAPTRIEPRPPGRKAYRAPQLTVFGPLSKLTQNGTGNTSESKGKSLCGAGYNTKGGSNC